MKNTLFVLALLLCGATTFAQQYTIKANITGFKDGTKFYLNDVDANANIDSAFIKKNVFTLKGKLLNGPQSLWFTTIVNKKYYYFTLFIGNEAIAVKGDTADFPHNLAITGSKIQDVHNELIGVIRDGSKRRSKLVQQYFALPPDTSKTRGAAIWKTIRGIDSVDQIARVAFVKRRINSYDAMQELFYLKGNLTKEEIQNLYSQLKPEYKESRYGKRIETYLRIGKILEKGDYAVDFDAVDPANKPHHLADYKGKYILLDFSTTYCGPCIESIVDMRKLADKYAGKLAIITYSGDANKDIWLKGHERDKPRWLSVWDGKGYFGDTSIKYGVGGYPTFVLIDPDGKIMSKWAGYGPGSVIATVDKLLPKP